MERFYGTPDHLSLFVQRLAITFRGRVQGVFFRATTERIARGFAVTGLVRNEPDGSVYCEVQGEADAVEAFVGAHKERRPGRVDKTETHDLTPVAGEVGFCITR